MENITIFDELIARSLVTKIPDVQASRTGIPTTLRKISTHHKNPKGQGDIVTYKWHNEQLYFICHNTQDLQEIAASLYETYIKGQYKQLKVKDKIVIDVGASIGESAIYFALKGAKHVYAYEPQPYAYARAVANIKLNALEHKITVINEAIGSKPGLIKVANTLSMGGSKLKRTEKGNDVKITTLTEVFTRFNIKEKATLKLDVEGAEYDILLASKWYIQSWAIKNFEQMAIEYHNGYLNLKRRLEKLGFKTWHTTPRVVFYDRTMRIGLLMAKKKVD